MIPTERHGNSLRYDRAIPGESLTAAPGEAAWEKPPQINTAEEAIDYVMYTIESKHEILQEIVGLMDAGIAIEALTEGLAFGGFVSGAWSPDTAELMKPGLAKGLWELSLAAGIEARIVKKAKKGPDGHNKIRRMLRPETLEEGGAGDLLSEEMGRGADMGEDVSVDGNVNMGEEDDSSGGGGGGFIDMMRGA
jgi:hypothetical protein